MSENKPEISQKIIYLSLPLHGREAIRDGVRGVVQFLVGSGLAYNQALQIIESDITDNALISQTPITFVISQHTTGEYMYSYKSVGLND